MRSKEEIARITGLDVEDILNVYAYGSEVYGCMTPASDEDYIVVTNGEHETLDVRNGEIDVTIYDVKTFQKKVDEHYISNLECLWLPDHLKIEDYVFSFELDKVKLRHSISECCSISYVKCKKRLRPDNYYYDPRSAKKSLWHSMRMAEFGCQIANHGKIVDYGRVNPLREFVLNYSDNWAEIQKTFQPMYNGYMSMFRSVAPKE